MATQVRYGRKVVVPSLDRTGDIPSTDHASLYASGQHPIFGGDRWGFTRWQVGVNTLLSWADPHTNDYRYKQWEDDRIQHVFPEVESPWKFPDNIYIVSGVAPPEGMDGYIVEPMYWEPDPTTPPSGIMYKINEHVLPEYGIRVAQSSGTFEAKSVTWGPEHNIRTGRMLMCAPLVWQGSKTNDIGETWELQGHPDWSYARYIEDPETGGYMLSGVIEGRFPIDPLMPHGDPEPLWNDGLDPQRIAWKDKHRREAAPYRGSSDMMIQAWGDLVQGDTVSAELNADGELEVTFNSNTTTESVTEKLLGKYDWDTVNIRWADPAHFNHISPQNFPRRMTKCLFCFNANKCRAANNPVNKGSATDLLAAPILADQSVGTLGFRRNYYVDVPTALVPNEPLAQLYAYTYCMYSTESAFERNFAAAQAVDESDADFLTRNNNTSDYCHVNGMPRRAVEYDGHYRLLKEEILTPLIQNHKQLILTIHKNNNGEQKSLLWDDKYTFNVNYIGLDYQQNHLYKVSTTGFPDELLMGQYDRQYGELLPEEENTLFYYSIKYAPAIQQWIIYRVWAYIWYVSAHTERSERVLVKRLVELKHDYGKYYGNLTEGRPSADFAGGSNNLETITTDRFDENPVKRGMYVKLGQSWIWMENQYTLSNNISTYKDDSNARASGQIDIIGMPGEVIPPTFLAYTPPKMVSWGKSHTDPNTQKNLGKTRWHWDSRRLDISPSGGWVKETGDIDDLYDHLRYDDPRAEGAVTNYPYDLGETEGYFSHFMNPSGNIEVAVNIHNNSEVKIADSLTDPSLVGDLPDKELNDLRDTDLILKSDIQHARNLTAPIFAYDLTSRVPVHHIVRNDLNLKEMDWGRRTMEPDNVMMQREYAPSPPIWCFSKNSQNRERYIQLRLNDDGERDVNGTIQRIWLPQGRVWWHQRGILGAGREWGGGAVEEGEGYVQTGIAVVNMWRKYLPHHMQVVRAYIWLEPVTDHYFAPFGGHPFEGMDNVEVDQSQTAQDIRQAKLNAGINTDIPGHPNIGYQIPIQAAWDLVETGCEDLMGEFELGGNNPMQWSPRVSKQGWSEYDMNHSYAPAVDQNNYNIARELKLVLNGHDIYNKDENRSNKFSQRNYYWYDRIATLFEDGGYAGFLDTTADPTLERLYYRNKNEFSHLNNRHDFGESDNGLPDRDYKAYGYSSGGGGRKAPFIFDITAQVRKAYDDRIDTHYETITDINAISKSSTAAGHTHLRVLESEGNGAADVFRGNETDNTVTSLIIGKEDVTSFALFNILMPPPNFGDTPAEDAYITFSYQTQGSVVWRTLYSFDPNDEASAYNIVTINNNLKQRPLICAKFRVTISGASMPPLIDMKYIPDTTRLPITGPLSIENFTLSNAISIGNYPFKMWTMSLKNVPAKIDTVAVLQNDGSYKTMTFGGELCRFVSWSANLGQTLEEVPDTFWYDAIDNAIMVARTDPTSGENLHETFSCSIEYVEKVGSSALVPIRAAVAGPAHDVDAEAISVIHEDDLDKLPQDDVLEWAVLNPEPLQGGYQYFEPEYKDVVVEETLANNPDIIDPRQDPGYGGRGTKWIKLGKMPDSFESDEENYQQYWYLDDTNEIISGAWKTKARGYVKFYGPPNTIIPAGIRLIAPAYIRPIDPNTQEDMLPNTNSGNALAPKIPNGGIKPAPLVFELQMLSDEPHPGTGFSRKLVGFRPHVMVYLRERTKFTGATHWKELGEGYGESTEVTGRPYWE